MHRFYLLLSCALQVSGCEFGGESGKLTPVTRVAKTCGAAPDPLEGGYHDDYDCVILDSVNRLGHPDAMLMKAQIEQESGFNPGAISPDSPCGIHLGWTEAESKSFGLTQVTPACGEGSGLLRPDGHPNLTTDPTSDLWPTSAYNPVANINEGVGACVRFLARMKTRWPGCSDAQYNLMSAGAYNSGDDAVTGCAMYIPRASDYVSAVLGHYVVFAASAGWHNPY
jgi:hypothetical protein